MQLVSKSFERQAIAFPEKVDQALAEIETVEEAKDLLDKASAMEAYAKRLQHGIDVARPISFGVLKIKAKLGDLMPAEKGGRGNKGDTQGSGFSRKSITGYRKVASNSDRLDEYMEDCDDVPSEADFLRWCNGVHVSKNSGENEWYTPPELIELARKAMGSIDFDPASSDVAQNTVGASEYLTIDDDGLSAQWHGNVWLNPPYSSDLVGKFTVKLRDELETGDVSQAVLLVNNATETTWFQSVGVACDAMCLLSGRVKFLDATGKPAKTPLQGQAVLYFGRRSRTFCNVFSGSGLIFER